jgi:hypothetical protein
MAVFGESGTLWYPKDRHISTAADVKRIKTDGFDVSIAYIAWQRQLR